MTRRLLIVLAVAGSSLLVAAVMALAGLIVATSAPELPPPPLPTATPQPVAAPNDQLQTYVSRVPESPAALTGAFYQHPGSPQAAIGRCSLHGHWSLGVNPESPVGHPFVSPPDMHDWARAAQAIATVQSICRASVALTWFAHDPARPTSDRWTASLPASIAVDIDGQALQRYALSHSRQA